MNIKEKVKNDIMVKMQYHLDSVTMDILGSVLIQTLSNVEVVEMNTLPAAVDDTNGYIIELFKMKKAPKLSEKTVAFYLDTVQNLILAVNKPLTKVTSMDIEMFLNTLKSTNSAVSLNNQRRNLSAFFTWMRKSHIILENPCDSVEAYKEMQKPIDHMEPEEFEQLKNGCKHKRDRAMIEFMRSTAMRVGEIPNVNVCDIDWRTGQINIYGEKTRSYRLVCLDSVALKYLSDYVLSRGISLNSQEPLFAPVRGDKRTALDSGSIRGAISTIRSRAGMNRRVYPHLFRKTTATNIVKRGGSVHDAGEYLGHKDRSTAGQHYTYISKEHIVEIFNKRVAAV
jgi:site-specific recombinase XerD